MARVRYSVNPRGGWTHIAGPTFQVHVGLDRSSAVIASMSSAADEADLAALSALLADHPECAFALFQHQPTQRLLVRGQACVEVRGEGHETFGPTADDALLDVSLDWAVSSVRLDACDGRVGRDACAQLTGATTDLAATSPTEIPTEGVLGMGVPQGPSPPQADADTRPPPLPAPPPDAWWLAGVRDDARHGSPSPCASGADVPIPAAPESSRRGPARWGGVTDRAASATMAPERAPRHGPIADARVKATFVLLSDGTRMPIEDTLVLGRAPGVGPTEESSVTLEITDGGRTVSRRHVSIRNGRDFVVVRDLGSRNGTHVYLRGRPPVSLRDERFEIDRSELPALVALSPDAVVWLDVPSRSSD